MKCSDCGCEERFPIVGRCIDCHWRNADREQAEMVVLLLKCVAGTAWACVLLLTVTYSVLRWWHNAW